MLSTASSPGAISCLGELKSPRANSFVVGIWPGTSVKHCTKSSAGISFCVVRRALVPLLVESVEPIRQIEIDRAAIDVQKRMLLDQLLLFVASFVGGRIAGRSRSRLRFGRQLRQFAFECLADNFVELRVALRGNLLQLGRHGVRFLASLIGPKANQPGVGRPPVLPVVRRFEDRSHAIVVGVRDRIVAMIVALGTSDRKPEHGGSIRS